MNPILSYETVRENAGDLQVYAVMNKPFIETLTFDDLKRLFSAEEEIFLLTSGDRSHMAFVLNADRNETAITEAVDIVNERGPETEIRTESIENRLGFGTDINVTALSLEQALLNVQLWLDAGLSGPVQDDTPEFPG